MLIQPWSNIFCLWRSQPCQRLTIPNPAQKKPQPGPSLQNLHNDLSIQLKDIRIWITVRKCNSWAYKVTPGPEEVVFLKGFHIPIGFPTYSSPWEYLYTKKNIINAKVARLKTSVQLLWRIICLTFVCPGKWPLMLTKEMEAYTVQKRIKHIQIRNRFITNITH